MFLFQDNKLYVDDNDSYVGVNITPAGIQKITSEKTNYCSGMLLTPHEVRCRFKNDYKFPMNEGDSVGRVRRSKKITKD